MDSVSVSTKTPFSLTHLGWVWGSDGNDQLGPRQAVVQGCRTETLKLKESIPSDPRPPLVSSRASEPWIFLKRQMM